MGDNYMKKINAVLEFIIVGAIGTLWHFVYDWTGDNHFIGFFFPVNESTWEHLKLIFFPALIYSVIEYYVIKNKPRNYIPAAVAGIFGGMLSSVVFFYTYTGIKRAFVLYRRTCNAGHKAGNYQVRLPAKQGCNLYFGNNSGRVYSAVCALELLPAAYRAFQ